MKIGNLLLSTALILTLNSTLVALDDGEKLFIQKCSSCHLLEFPDSRSKLKASPLPGLMFKLNQNISSDEKLVTFIKDFVINPTEDKIIYDRRRKFGSMESLKGKITEEELDVVANWMVENIFMTRKQFKAAKLNMKRSSNLK